MWVRNPVFYRREFSTRIVQISPSLPIRACEALATPLREIGGRYEAAPGDFRSFSQLLLTTRFLPCPPTAVAVEVAFARSLANDDADCRRDKVECRDVDWSMYAQCSFNGFPLTNPPKGITANDICCDEVEEYTYNSIVYCFDVRDGGRVPIGQGNIFS